MHTLGPHIPIEMLSFMGAIGIAVILVGIAIALGGFRIGIPNVRSKPLMTDRERAALQIIERVLPHARIYVQVSMGALLQPARGTSQRDYLSVRNRFSQKIVDFVVEDRSSGKILALVELDDRSHNAIRDVMRDRMTASAGYRTIRIPAGRLTTADVAHRLLILQPPVAAPGIQAPRRG